MTNVSSVPSYLSVNPVHPVVPAEFVKAQAMANPPAGMSNVLVGSAVPIYPAVSVAVALANSVAAQTPAIERTIVAP